MSQPDIGSNRLQVQTLDHSHPSQPPNGWSLGATPTQCMRVNFTRILSSCLGGQREEAIFPQHPALALPKVGIPERFPAFLQKCVNYICSHILQTNPPRKHHKRMMNFTTRSNSISSSTQHVLWLCVCQHLFVQNWGKLPIPNFSRLQTEVSGFRSQGALPC